MCRNNIYKCESTFLNHFLAYLTAEVQNESNCIWLKYKLCAYVLYKFSHRMDIFYQVAVLLLFFISFFPIIGILSLIWLRLEKMHLEFSLLKSQIFAMKGVFSKVSYKKCMEVIQLCYNT